MAESFQLQCRMYENRFPEVDDLVMVHVRQIAEMGAYVNLLEYNNIEGMILLSELSKRRIRSIQKLIRVGRNEVVVVLRVDKEKGYIDLSKRRVTSEEIAKCEEKYNKSKAVHSIMRHIAEEKGLNLEDFYSKVGWPLYKKYGHAYDAFKLSITDSSVFEGLEMDEGVKDTLVENIKHRLTPQPVKIRSDVEVTCFSYDGIDGIIATLTAAEEAGTEEIPIKVKLIAAPLYVITTQALDKQQGISIMEKAIEIMTETIRKYKGEITVTMRPRAVTESDDKQLSELMVKANLENLERDGDDDSDD